MGHLVLSIHSSLCIIYLNDTTLTKAKEPSLPYYIPITGGRIIGFPPFPRVLVLHEMQSASSRFDDAMSISFNDNHYTTGTCVCVCVCVRACVCMHACVCACAHVRVIVNITVIINYYSEKHLFTCSDSDLFNKNLIQG